MKSIKRVWTGDDDNLLKRPLKKQSKKKVEKENKNSYHREEISTRKKNKTKSTVLEDFSLPSKRISEDENSSSSEFDSNDEELKEILRRLVKNGFKTDKSSAESSKKKLESNKTTLSSEKNNAATLQLVPSLNQNKSKRNLGNELDNLKISPKKPRKKSFKRIIPELEELPEDITTDFKKTPNKISKFKNETTPIKESSTCVPLRRSSRRSSFLQEEIIFEKELTPILKTNNTSNQNEKIPTPKTPKSTIEKKLPSTPLEKARLSLHVSAVPDCLPCREKEYENIFMFLENKLLDGIGGCMYISGVPGTGKTATVTQVVKRLQDLSKIGKVPEFKYIEINGMRLTDPRQVYFQIWQKLFDKKQKITADRAHKYLDDWFSKSDKGNSRLTTVLLVDELDLMCTKKQDVVYNLLDWPTRTHSRLVVLTIANNMDMPERLFKGRVTSRMGLTRLTFMPYTHKQLEEIILTRLHGLDAFVTDAVRLVTRKVAAVSGDARRALDICRRAAELPRPDETVKISHIEQALREMTNSNIIKVIRNCGEMEKLFLRSLSDVSIRSNIEEVDLREVIDQVLAVCVLEGFPRPSVSSILSVSNKLRCSRLIFSNQSHAGIWQKLTLNVTQDDIHYALKT